MTPQFWLLENFTLGAVDRKSHLTSDFLLGRGCFLRTDGIDTTIQPTSNFIDDLSSRNEQAQGFVFLTGNLIGHPKCAPKSEYWLRLRILKVIALSKSHERRFLKRSYSSRFSQRQKPSRSPYKTSRGFEAG